VIDLAVIGAGVMGTHHARVAMGLRGAQLVAIVEPDVEAGQRLAERTGAEHVADIADVIDRIDAAIVAVPTDRHVAVGKPLLEAGIHVWMEKPLASTATEGEELIAAARAAGAVFMVGHVERFNPAVLELKHILDDPVHLDAARIGRFAPRVDDSVVVDLMIHDLDVVCSLVGDYEPQVTAMGRKVVTSEPDIVTAMLVFDSGATAVLTASRIGQHKIRRLEITQRDAFVVADLLKQTVLIQRATRSGPIEEGGYRQESVIEIPYLRHQGEPLYLEQSHFVECVTEGAEPLVDGSVGLKVLELALHIRDQVG
jgi:predicted dehydrogenase